MLCRIFNIGNSHVQIAELAENGSLRPLASLETAEFHPEEYNLWNTNTPCFHEV